MLARLGIVLYWVSCLEVLAIVGFGLLVLSTYGHRQGDLGAYIIFLGVLRYHLNCLGLGRACRPVLAGT